jgi:signal transduction histidine kinase/ligand-binding sensor domain-containing protein/AraC-like DNA-binding protein/ActR/RegA family two-component response regulator
VPCHRPLFASLDFVLFDLALVRRCFHVLAIPLGATAVSAQAAAVRPDSAPLPLVVESWSVADGLPLNSVNALRQSRDGFLWAATYDGLVRFDGARFRVYNAANSPGLTSDRIIFLDETRDGSLWLTTEPRALVRFSRGRFTPMDATAGLTGEVYAVYEEPAGPLWVGTTDGLFVWRDGRFEHAYADALRGQVVAILRRRDGSLWIGTQASGLYRIADGRVERMRGGSVFEGDGFVSFFEDPGERLWIHKNDPIGHRSVVWVVPRGGRPGPMPDWSGSGLRRFDWVPGWRAVVGFAVDGLLRFDGATATSVVARRRDYTIAIPMQLRGRDSVWHAIGRDIYVNDRRVASLPPSADAPNAQVIDLLVDRDGDVWLATTGIGLVRLRRSVFTVLGAPEGLGATNAYAVVQDSAGALWVGSIFNGASRIATDRRTIDNFGPRQGYPAPAAPMLVDGPDRLLVGAVARLDECTIPRMRCQPVAIPDSGVLRMLALHRTADGRVVAGAHGQVYERIDNRWRRLPGWTSASRARAFADTRDGALWIGTGGDGLVRCRTGRCRTLRVGEGLPSDFIRTLHVDADGWLWVGTEGHGLARLDPRDWPADDAAHRPRVVHYDVADGLFDPVVHQILEDGMGRFWINSNRGLYWVRRDELLAFAEGRTSRIVSTAYTERDGLRNREGNGGYQPAGVRDRAGILWFPTQAGVVGVDPRRVPSGRTPPPVAVEQVAARGRAYPVDTAVVELAADARDLEVTYTAIAFQDPRNVRFRFRLEPYDRDWVDAGTRRTAFYTRVPPGRYVFRVQASQGGGQWSERPAVATLELAPFLYETALAKALAALLLLGAGVGAIRWREQTLRRRETELTALVAEATAALRRNETELASQNAKLAELHTLRSRLFANLSHEFRTPLTLILGPLRNLLDGRHGELPGGVREQAQLMQRNGHRLLRLINQILDLARLQAGAVTLRRQPIELVDYVRSLAHAFLPLAEQKGIGVVVRSPGRAITVAADAEHLEKVLLNLLSNAVKFTGAGGTVEVAVADDETHATITVRDTGIGIRADDLPFVFERFYQADSEATRRYDGSGIGLALAKELVELHGGTITVASVVGEGSCFTVRLPVGAIVSADGAALGARRAALEDLLRSETGERRVPAAAAVTSDASPSADDHDDDRPLVLVVDDNADVRTYVRSVLAPEYRILEAADGRAGLATAREALPDLIVSDVMMPELDGLDLGRALKGDPMTDAIPVILLTARAATVDQIAGFDAGAEAYLVKPFDPGVLTAAVGGLLAQRRRLRERIRTGETAPPAAPAAEPSVIDRELRPLVLARLQDPTFNPDALAESAGLSYHQLYRALRDQLDLSPSRYIRTVRAEVAAELLATRAGTVTEVAYAVGFESLSYFRRAFKERFDRSPSEFVASPPPVSGGG